MKWFGPVQWITKPNQSSWIWTGLDQEITHMMDSGLDWIREKYFVMSEPRGMYFLKAEQNGNACHGEICSLSLYCRALTVIPGAIHVHKYITSLDWTGLVQSLHVRPGLDWIRIAAFGSGLVWIALSQSISYSDPYIRRLFMPLQNGCRQRLYRSDFGQITRFAWSMSGIS